MYHLPHHCCTLKSYKYFKIILRADRILQKLEFAWTLILSTNLNLRNSLNLELRATSKRKIRTCCVYLMLHIVHLIRVN